METRLAVHVLDGEGADRAAQDESEHEKGNRETVVDEFHLEVVDVVVVAVVRMQRNPVAEIENDLATAGCQHTHEDPDRRDQRYGHGEADQAGDRRLAGGPANKNGHPHANQQHDRRDGHHEGED